MSTYSKILTSLTGILAAASVLTAQPYVDFGGDYGYQSIANGGVADNEDALRNADYVYTNIAPGQDQAVLPINDSSPMWTVNNVAGGSGRPSGTVYAAQFMSHAGDELTSPPKGQMNYDEFEGDEELLQLDARNFPGAVDSTQNEFLYWNKADFLNGGDTATINLANIYINASVLGRTANSLPDEVALHWIIRDGSGNFYASQDQVVVFANDWVNLWNQTGLDALNWVAFDNASLDVRPTLETAAVVDTTDITGFGVLFSNYNVTGGSGTGNRTQARVARFQVTTSPTTVSTVDAALEMSTDGENWSVVTPGDFDNTAGDKMFRASVTPNP